MSRAPGRPAFQTKKKSRKFFEWVRLEYIRLGGRCPLCNVIMEVPRSGNKGDKGNMATLDHIVDLAKGGTNDYSNFQLICLICNRKKNKKENI